MEKNHGKLLVWGIIFVIVFGFIFFLLQYSALKSEPRNYPPVLYKPLENNKIQQEVQKEEEKILEEELKYTVNFCGKEYRTNGAVINGVEVIGKIAEIATKNPKDYVCNNINTNQSDDKLIVSVENSNGKDYYITLHSYFRVTGNDIYLLSGFDGSPTFYGRLK